MGILHEYTRKVMIVSRKLFLKLEMFQTKYVDKLKTHILYSVTSSRKIMLFMR